MLQPEQQGIERPLVDSQKVSADLLDAPHDFPAVLRPQDIQRLEDTIRASVPCKTSGETVRAERSATSSARNPSAA